RWDGDQLVGQRQYLADGTAAREVQWVYEPGSFRPLAQVESKAGQTQLHYIVTDLTGTARELCSEAGEVHWRGEHREERLPIRQRRYLGDAANEEVYCELRYQGQLYDAETGLYYNRHRYYDAESGQYISPDPIGLAGGLNNYAYAPNPLTWIDPLGLARCKPEKWDVDSHQNNKNAVKGLNLGLDSHHVGQKNIMKDLVEGYDPVTAPAILVPRVGHTVSKEGVGIVSRSRINSKTGLPFDNARDVVARDIRELRRVYPDIPNSKLKELIDMNKKMYPELR
ncbi:RHS repeat-associated core domain-containing protein, partial [Brenneria nigrifluens]|uniref:RHS repeat-associated core domain-containing protein n=1 Tax=Brenneria nigrifluens TaxID=55210 RepID=UPI001B34767B